MFNERSGSRFSAFPASWFWGGMGGLGYAGVGDLFEVVEAGFQLDSGGRVGGEGTGSVGGDEGSFQLSLTQLIEATMRCCATG